VGSAFHSVGLIGHVTQDWDGVPRKEVFDFAALGLKLHFLTQALYAHMNNKRKKKKNTCNPGEYTS
jgi:hypothetical protein